jgi:ketosteroid isomerase-like protein
MFREGGNVMKLLLTAGRAMAVSIAALLTVGLAGPRAGAHDAGLEAKNEAAQERYEDAWTGGDVDALVELYSEDAVLWPFSGGMYEGRDAIRGFFQDNPRMESFDLRSERTERVGDFVLDVGTLIGTMPADAGGRPVEGQYVAIAREEDGELKLHRLFAAPRRQGPQRQ